MAGSVLVWAYQATGLEKYKLACDSIRKAFDSYPRMTDGGFWHGDWCPNQMWVDGLFMGLMFLTRYGKVIGDSEYCFNETSKQLESINNHCRKGNTGLLLHAWTEDKNVPWADPINGCSPEVWSEGLGWYGMILVEVLEDFPLNHPGRNQIITQLNKLLESLADNLDVKTGLWYQVVDKGNLSDNWNDTSGSAMFIYTIKKAIDLGLASEERFGEIIKKGYEGITTKAKVNEDGLIDILDACDGVCVQNDYKSYITFEKVLNAKEAVAAFLWATGIVENPKKQVSMS